MLKERLKHLISGSGDSADSLAKGLSQTAYLLLLCCIAAVTVAFSHRTYHPFDPIKELLLHFFILLGSFLLIVRVAFTNTLSIQGNSLHLFIALYFAYNALSFAVAQHADKAYFVNLTFLILLSFITSLVVRSRTQYLCLLYLLAFAVIISSIYGLYAQFPLSTRLLGKSILSFFGNQNLFAAFLVVNLPLLFSGFFTGKRRAKRLFALSIILAVFGLLLSGTRAALLGAAISAALFLVLTWGESDRKRYLWAVSSVAVLVMAGFLYSSQTVLIKPLQFRQHLWQNSLEIVRDHPLFGTGVGSFNVYYPAYRKRSIWD